MTLVLTTYFTKISFLWVVTTATLYLYRPPSSAAAATTSPSTTIPTTDTTPTTNTAHTATFSTITKVTTFFLRLPVVFRNATSTTSASTTSNDAAAPATFVALER